MDFVDHSGESDKRTILEANGAGVALLDLGNDGDLDVVFAQGLEHVGQLLTGPGADLAIFDNDGTGHFTRSSGLGLSGWWTGLASGDVDNDGDADLVAAGFGSLVLLLQDAQGRLVPDLESGLMPSSSEDRWIVGQPREKGHPPLWPTSIALFDADRDGWLDLYVGQYLDFDPVAPPLHELEEGALAVPCRWKGYEVFCGPRGLPAQPDRLLRGVGGRFSDVSASSLPDQHPGYTLAVVPFDADGDGDSDLFVANDSTPNLLLINDGHGVFHDQAYAANVAYSADGRAQAGMGIATGDVNRDGLLDVVVTNFSDEPTELYFGSRVGFARMTFRYGLQSQTRRLLSWGVHLFDCDGDGWLELFTCNGHVYPQADLANTGTRYGQPATMWSLGPESKARAIEAKSERSILAAQIGARGSAAGDLDGDGAPDLVLSRIDAPAALGINHFSKTNHRLIVRLLGPHGAPPTSRSAEHHTSADAIGARAVVIAGAGSSEFALLGEVETAAGFQSSSSPWISFGLGREREYRTIRIVWPSGRVEELPAGKADRRLTVREGQGLISAEEFH